MNHKPLIFALATLLLTSSSLAAQQAEANSKPELQLKIEKALRDRTQVETRELDIDLMMLGHDYCGTEPSRPTFSLDGQSFWFRWKKDEEKSARYFGDLGTGIFKRVTEDSNLPPSYNSAVHSADGRYSAYIRRGGVYLFDHNAASTRLVRSDDESKTLLGFSKGNSFLVFSIGDRIFSHHLEDKLTTQMLKIVKANSDRKAKETEQRRHVREAEEELLRHTYKRKQAADELKKKTEETPSRFVECAYPRRYSKGRLTVAPTLTHFALTLFDSGKTERTEVPHYITDDGYVESRRARSKVGDSNFQSRLFVGEVQSGKGQIVSFDGWKDDYRARTASASPDGKRFLTVLRSLDNKRASLFVVDSATGKSKLLHEVKDEAWVRHVGDSYGFLPDGRAWFTSEKTGFNHLYIESKPGGDVTALTTGNWLIERVHLDQKHKRFLLTTTRNSPHTRRLDAVPFGGGEIKELINVAGWNQCYIAPDHVHMIYVHSRSNRPPELYLRRIDDEPSAMGQQLTDSPTPAFKARQWYTPEIRYFEASDGTKVPMRLYLPDEKKTRMPAVIFVHGAGYLQNVIQGWSPYYREYMFHNFLRERGYVVADVDYRGSAGYGRDWRCAIYRHMGGKDLDDQVDAARYLTENCGVSKDRIGIYGGSYGGFITLMALFTKPGVFQSGAALRPVTDWAHYNHGYTSNILNTPAGDPEAYRRSSPIYHAQGLKGRLLICHGLVDDNVQIQDSFRLTQRLIELRKTNWELAVYPVEPHGFRDPASWADEYKRIFRLFEETIGVTK